MNTTEILQGLKKPVLGTLEQIDEAIIHNAALDAAIAALEKAMLEKAGEK